MKKVIKWVLGCIILLPGIIGIPDGIRIMSHHFNEPPLEFGGWRAVCAIPGTVYVILIAAVSVVGLVALIFMELQWIFSDK